MQATAAIKAGYDVTEKDFATMRSSGLEIAEHLYSLFKEEYSVPVSRWDTVSKWGVPTRKIVAGLSFLCQGTGSSKIEAAFEIFNRVPSRCLICFNDLAVYLSAFMEVSFELNPSKRGSFPRRSNTNGQEKGNSFYLTADEVGLATARSCFRKLGKTIDSPIGLDEFDSWFSAGKSLGV
mmetsp:Transcript_21451/g.40190  ORF Transcript_21451/g.40190 Transcript_21451/m.40190 type:complete len:179 (-) Transcript_21451:374-910(-)